MELTKENIYNQMQKYLYAHNFSDLKVFSKQYFHSVVMPCYKDNTKTEPYSVISIDFNDMQKINQHGFKRGDEILHDSIEIMQSVMPKDSYCIRMGGDEFLFFLNNVPKEQGLEYEKQMHKKLEEFSKKIDSTTVTSYCISSKDSNSLSSLIDIADSAINVIKQTAKDSKCNSIGTWDILQNKVSENIGTFFKTLRFHKFPMQVEHMHSILTRVITSYDSFIKEDSKDNNSEEKQMNNEDSNFKHEDASSDDLPDIHNLFVNHRFSKPTPDELDKYSTSSLANLLNSLVRDPLTMQFNKSYLIQYLLGDEKQNLKALRLSATFVKVANTINDSHSSTDKQIERLGNDIYSFLNNKIDFNQDTFSNNPLNFMIALDGGDMLLALNPKTNLKAKDIKEYLNVQNSSNYSNDNLLRLVAADSFRKITKNNLDKVLIKQSEECNKNKVPLISNLLNDEIIDNLLSVVLRDTMSFYKELVPDINDIEAKSKYVHLVSNTILNMYSTLDVVHDDEKSQNFFTKFTKKVSSVFKNKPLTLPEPSKDSFVNLSSKSSNIFVPKATIDHTKTSFYKGANKKTIKDRNDGLSK